MYLKLTQAEPLIAHGILLFTKLHFGLVHVRCSIRVTYPSMHERGAGAMSQLIKRLGRKLGNLTKSGSAIQGLNRSPP